MDENICTSVKCRHCFKNEMKKINSLIRLKILKEDYEIITLFTTTTRTFTKKLKIICVLIH